MTERSKYCTDLIFKSAAGLFDEVRAGDLIKDLEERAASKSGTQLDRLTEAARDLVSETKNKHLQAKHVAYLNILKESNIRTNYIDRFKNAMTGLDAVLDGVQQNVKDSRFSTGSIQIQTVKKYFGRFLNDLNKEDLLPVFKSRPNDLELAKALRNEPTTNPKVARVAEIIKNLRKEMDKEGFSHGLEHGELADFGVPQTHNVSKILKGNLSLGDKLRLLANHGLEFRRQFIKDRWVNFVKARLDLPRSFRNMSDADVTKVLGDIHDGIISGNHFQPPKTTPEEYALAFKAHGSLAKQVAAHRKLHFKDATSWYEYNKVYGNGSTALGVISHIKGYGEQIGLAHVWGTNPENMYDNIVKYVKKKNPYVKKLKLYLAQSTFRKLTGYLNIPESPTLAKTGAALRSWQSLAHLGHVLPTSMNDLAIRASLLQNAHGINFFESWLSGITEMLPGFTNKEQKMVLDSIGVWSDSQFGHAIRYFSVEDSPMGTLPDMMNLFFKLTGMTWWDQVHKEGVATILSRYMALRRNSAFGRLPKGEQRTLKFYGLEEKEWDLIRHKDHILNPYGNKKMVSPDAVQHFSDENIKAYLGNKDATPRQIQAVKDDIETRLRTYFLDQVDHAIITPSASDRTLAEFGTRPGTPEGEIMRQAGQFKYFGIGTTRRVGGRIFFSTKGETQSVFTNYGAIIPWINFAVTATGMGYISGAIYDLLSGKTPMPADHPETWLRAINRGATGIFGQILFNSYQKFGTRLSSQIAGPVPGTIDDVASLVAKVITWNKPGVAAVNFAQRNIPFGNLWMTDVALKALFLDDLKDRLDPGYKHRVNRELRKHGQTLWYR